MAGVLADTHAIIWYLTKSNRLSDRALEAFESAIRSNDKIYISVITIVEMVYLVEKNKIPSEAFEQLIYKIDSDEIPIEVIPLDLSVSSVITSIPRDIVPDMPDRIIAATAQYHELPLITRDAHILRLKIETIW